MKQLGLGDHGFAKGRKTTRRERFLNEMDAVVPWARLVALIAPHYPTAVIGDRPRLFPIPLRLNRGLSLISTILTA